MLVNTVFSKGKGKKNGGVGVELHKKSAEKIIAKKIYLLVLNSKAKIRALVKRVYRSIAITM